jgi:hypothetical protein
MIQGHHSSKRRIESGHIIRQRKGRADRRAVRISLHIGVTGKCLQRGSQPGQFSVGSGLAVACYMGHDDIRVDFPHFLYTDPPFFKGPCLEIFNDHVAFFDQIQEKLFPFFVVEIQGNAFFISSHTGPADALPILQRSHGPERISPSRHFHFNDFCPKICQKPCCPGSSNDRGDIQYPYTFQCLFLHMFSSLFHDQIFLFSIKFAVHSANFILLTSLL